MVDQFGQIWAKALVSRPEPLRLKQGMPFDVGIMLIYKSPSRTRCERCQILVWCQMCEVRVILETANQELTV